MTKIISKFSCDHCGYFEKKFKFESTHFDYLSFFSKVNSILYNNIVYSKSTIRCPICNKYIHYKYENFNIDKIKKDLTELIKTL